MFSKLARRRKLCTLAFFQTKSLLSKHAISATPESAAIINLQVQSCTSPVANYNTKRYYSNLTAQCYSRHGRVVYPGESWKSFQKRVDDNYWIQEESASMYAKELMNAPVERVPFVNEDDTWQEMNDEDDPYLHCYNLTNCLVQEESISKPLIVSKTSRKVWNLAFTYLTKNKPSNVIVTGNPGIGKTRSMAYMLRLLLLDGRLVVYTVGKVSQATFMFVPVSYDEEAKQFNYIVWRCVSKFEQETCAALHNADNYYLIDPPETPKERTGFQAHICTAASPNIAHYKGLQKLEYTDKLFIPIATEEEVTAMYKKLRELNAVNEIITPALFKQRLYRFGPVPRYLFRSVNDLPNVDAGIRLLSQDDIKQVIKKFDTPVDLDLNQEQKAPSAVFGCYIKDPQLPVAKMYHVSNIAVRPISKYAVEEVCIKYWELLNEYLLPDDVWMVRYPALMGSFYEKLALVLLATGCKFKQITVADKKNNEVDQPFQPMTPLLLKTVDSSNEGFFKQIASISEKDFTLFKPNHHNLPVVDAMSSPRIGYQITVSSRHKINLHWLLKMQTILKFSPQHPLQIYVIMPFARENLQTMKLEYSDHLDNETLKLLTQIKNSNENSKEMKKLATDMLKIAKSNHLIQGKNSGAACKNAVTQFNSLGLKLVRQYYLYPDTTHLRGEKLKQVIEKFKEMHD